jgi:hypothetical protein
VLDGTNFNLVGSTWALKLSCETLIATFALHLLNNV